MILSGLTCGCLSRISWLWMAIFLIDRTWFFYYLGSLEPSSSRENRVWNQTTRFRAKLEELCEFVQRKVENENWKLQYRGNFPFGKFIRHSEPATDSSLDLLTVPPRLISTNEPRRRSPRFTIEIRGCSTRSLNLIRPPHRIEPRATHSPTRHRVSILIRRIAATCGYSKAFHSLIVIYKVQGKVCP